MEADDNQNGTSSARRVIASAIDENCLTLEEPDTGYKISWPLDKIPRPLDLGNELNLILQCGTENSEYSQTRTSTESKAAKTSSPTPREEEMRRMLENLVN